MGVTYQYRVRKGKGSQALLLHALLPRHCRVLQVNAIETNAEALTAVVFHSFHLLLISVDSRGYVRVNNGADGNLLNAFHVSNGEFGLCCGVGVAASVPQGHRQYPPARGIALL